MTITESQTLPALMVDDEQTICKTVAMWLKAGRHRIVAFSNLGDAAIEARLQAFYR